jgi:hypothetical protein
MKLAQESDQLMKKLVFLLTLAMTFPNLRKAGIILQLCLRVKGLKNMSLSILMANLLNKICSSNRKSK